MDGLGRRLRASLRLKRGQRVPEEIQLVPALQITVPQKLVSPSP
uniref:DENN domain containing 2D n=1 Tax=Mus musculus TaxID=10090 RepID=A0A0A6YWK8_MOUSE